MSTVSPLAPETFPELPMVPGVRLATHAAGLRYEKRADLFLAEVVEGTTVAGVFTQSLCASAPVDWCRRVLPNGTARAIVCNSGNANAFTGRAGETSTQLTAETIASELNVRPDDIFLASTGVIGETLPDAALAAALPTLVAGLTTPSPGTWQAAADAIRTTDTFAKGAFAGIEGTDAVVVGIAKGSGMIAPDMATMLAFVFTDLEVPTPLLQAALNASVERSFNRITVDSDTSTSDTVLAFATGADGAHAGVVDSPGYTAFRGALDTVLLDLAHQIVRDGEGATKFVTVTVTGAEHETAAKRIALAVANSPLVKTALAAEDANWGRIVMAVGKAGERADRDEVAIRIGPELVASRGVANSPLVKTALAAEDANWGRIVMAVGKAGERADRDAVAIRIGPELVASRGVAHPDYSEDRATRHLQGDEIDITVDVGIGDGVATVWTCDLTHGYIDINAGYRS